MKVCRKCGNAFPDFFFFRKKDVCKACVYPGSIEVENQLLAVNSQKKCTVCKKILSFSDFHKTNRTKTGLRSVCIVCRSESVRIPGAKEDAERKKALLQQGLKECTKCRKIKTTDQFYKKHGSCKQCSIKTSKTSRKKHYTSHKKEVSLYAKKINNRPSKSKKLFSRIPSVDLPIIDVDGFITVKCYKCHKRFRPKRRFILNRIGAFEGILGGERNLYCSRECKSNCPTYGFIPGKQIDPRSKLYAPPTEAEKARAATKTATIKKALCDKHGALVCDRCGDVGDVELHHTLPVAQHGMESVNPDSYLFLCPGCHVALHRECA